jgi:tetratricopeptide (TPR) repeat protein
MRWAFLLAAAVARACAHDLPQQADPSIESLADSIESAWNSGEFKRAAALFRSANKMSSSEFRISYRLVALLTEYLSSAKLYREALLAADILVAIYPNLFQAHLARTRALTMLRLWDAAAVELSVVRRLQPSLQLLSTYQHDISTAAAKDAAAQGTRPNHSVDGAESSRSAHTDGDEDVTLDSWGNILRGLTHREFIPYVIFDTVACSCFIAIYTYMCRSKAATAKAAKAANAAVPAAAPLPLQPAVALRRSRP